MNEQAIESLDLGAAAAAHDLFKALPKTYYWSVTIQISSKGITTIQAGAQAGNQREVRELMSLLPHTIWKKNYREDCQWWEYNGNCDGIKVNIYACSEAPPTCKAVEETYEVEEAVPVAFETRTVTKKRMRWDCGDKGEAKS